MKKKDNIKPLSKKEQAFARDLVRSLAESALINGDITLDDFSDKKKLLTKLKKLIPKKDEDLLFSISYQPSLLEEAEFYSQKNRFDMAYVMYATYFEHFINEIIDIWARQNSINHDSASNLMRKISLEDKYTWILQILKLPKFNRERWKTIKFVSEKRNTFLHYKYKPEPPATPPKTKQNEWVTILPSLQKAVTYTKKYRSRVVFNRGKKKFDI